MKHLKDQSGVVLVLELALVVAVLAIAGVGIYTAMQNKSAPVVATKPQIPSKSSSPSPQATAAGKKLKPSTPVAASTATPLPTTPPATSKIIVTGVKDHPGTDYGITGYIPPQGQQRAISVTITNLTNSTQSYDNFQFSAASDTGVVVGPHIYSPAESTDWNSSTVASGNSQSVVILFPIDKNLVTLTWTPAGGGTRVTVPLPSPSTN